MIKIYPIPAFSDNYIWAVNNQQHCTVVDPGDAAPVLDYLQQNKLTLDNILITHYHPDHIGGISDLLKQFPEAHVFGPESEEIPHCNTTLRENDEITLPSLGLTFQVLDVPGHTSGHIAYFNDDILFCGDTLFSAGCGRMFEGTPEQFHSSLQKFAHLDANTKVYCTHEYTLANLEFAKSIEADNKDLQQYTQHCKALRKQDKPTLPSSIQQELDINPFLRCYQDNVIEKALQLGAKSSQAVDVFAALRSAKDNF